MTGAAGFNWRLLGNGYVAAEHGRMFIYLHRLILGAGVDDVVDHLNRDPLDNRRCNLRFATYSLNGANRVGDSRRAGVTSRHKGVSWNRERRRWRAYIHVDGKTRALGAFTDELDAARAYNAAAVAAWGEYARLNDVPDLEGTAPAGDDL